MEHIEQLFQKAQGLFHKNQEELGQQEVEAEVGAGLVRVKMNGLHQVMALELSEDCLQQDKCVIEELTLSAMNAATKKADQLRGANLPAMDWSRLIGLGK